MAQKPIDENDSFMVLRAGLLEFEANPNVLD
jgi:hypothetical protein